MTRTEPRPQQPKTMKRPQPLQSSYCHRLLLASLGTACAIAGQASAATGTWIAGQTGNYSDSTKWTDGIIPNAAADIAVFNGNTSVIGIGAADTITLATANIGVDNAGNHPTINQAGGTFTVNAFNFGGAGASRSPIYNLSGGTLQIAGFAWGAGSATAFNVSGGTANVTGGSFSMGTAGGARAALTMTGGTFNANSVGQMNIGNTGAGNGGGTISLSGTAQFNANAATLVIGQFGAPTSSATNTFGTLTMADTSTLNAVVVVVGGNNAASAVNGVINLNGGTLSAGSVRRGASNLTPDANTLILNANGGTIKATTHANNANYFQNLPVNLGTGGLKFDTNDNFVTVTNVLAGTGGFEKRGGGTLTLTGLSTYTGNTTVTAGELVLNGAFLNDSSTLTVSGAATLNLAHGIEDIVGSLIVNGIAYTTGTVGSADSGADVALPQFTGFGKIRVGLPPVPHNLVWTGAVSDLWTTLIAPPDNNFLEGITPTFFRAYDNVTFDDSSTAYPVFLSGNVQAGVVTLNGALPYLIDGAGSGILGTASIVMNNTGTVTLGGETSSFTGAVAVNAGTLVVNNDKALGANSGVTIASGAQVDLNGKVPGSLYTYTIAGNGPGGTGAIVNRGAAITSSSGGVKSLILTADASIGSDTNRFDIGGGGTVTGNGHTLTKIGTNDMGFRGNAGGSPLNVVIAAGNVWAETSGNAFGGSTGTLTIKSGARAGNFGTLTIPTPVTIENGGRLHNQGAGTGTWSGNFALQGDVTFEGDGSPIVVNGVVSGSANLTKTGTFEVTFNSSAFPGNAGYIGNTIVTQGKLTLAAPALADSGDVTIETGGSLNLTHGVADTVHSLTMEGVPAVAGVWGSLASSAPNKTGLIEGTGTLNVTTGSTPEDGYGTWASANGVDGVPSSTDSDGDGIPNGIEFVIGGDPSAPGSDSNALKPTATIDATYINFVFRRTDASASYAPFVEYNSNLGATWTKAEAGVNGVVIDEVNDDFGAGIDRVTVRIPRTLASGAKIFARLRVDIP